MSQECDRSAAKEISEVTGGAILGWLDLEELAEIISNHQLPDRLQMKQTKKDLANCEGLRAQDRKQFDDQLARQKKELIKAETEAQRLLSENSDLQERLWTMTEKCKDLKSRNIQLVEVREDADRKTLRMEEAVRKANSVLIKLRTHGI